MPRKVYSLTSIIRVIPNSDGSRIAVFTISLTNNDLDLWVINRRLGSGRLVYPYISAWSLADSEWDGNRLVFERAKEYWSIKYNGKDLKPVLEQRWWQQ
jgi:hypothetical protein